MSNLLTPATLEDIKPPVTNNKKASTDFKRTQKHYDTKISSVLKSLQEMDDDDANNLGDFTPPTNPISVGGEKKTESMQTRQLPIQSHVYSTDGLELNNLKYTYQDDAKIENYYKNYVPNYTNPNQNQNMNQPVTSDQKNHIQDYKPKYIPNNISHNNAPGPYMASDQNILLEKLNYMIHLLEDKQDLKTKSTFEEILLYCFLGIFTIFLVDSFSRVGKYIR
jgi:hypothetical protein